MKTKLIGGMALGAVMVAASALAFTAAERGAPVAKPANRLVIVPTNAAGAPAAPTAAAPLAPRLAASAALWLPRATDTWQWQLSGKVNTGYDVAVYDVDLFDTPTATLDRLHAAGRRIICYFSAGSSENWRADYDQFTAADQGRPLDGWAGEKWLDVRSANVRRIMGARLDLAKTRGCDAVEPDNVDGYSNANGLGLTAADQLDYNRFLADAAHARGLAVGLKNDLAQVKALEPAFDFAVNEQCAQYRECDKLKPFTAAGKPVFNAEYAAKYRNNTGGARTQLCQASRAANIRTLVLPLKLNDAYRYSCD
jgi:hypothetical protein